jgi:hypothetical protein
MTLLHWKISNDSHHQYLICVKIPPQSYRFLFLFVFCFYTIVYNQDIKKGLYCILLI